MIWLMVEEFFKASSRGTEDSGNRFSDRHFVLILFLFFFTNCEVVESTTEKREIPTPQSLSAGSKTTTPSNSILVLFHNNLF